MIQNTHEFPQSEFPVLATNLREEMHTRPRFTLPMSGGSAELALYTIKGEYQGATLSINDDPGLTFQYGPIAIEDFGEYASNWGLSPLPARQAEGEAQTIDADAATELIKDAKGNLIFFSGAGISNAGFDPVYDHAALEQRLGFIDADLAQEYYADPQSTNDWFIDQFLANPDYRNRVAKGYNIFLDRMFVPSATVAHVAVRHMVKKYDFAPDVLTSNYDCKHEASGIEAVKIPAGWHHETGSSMGDKARQKIEEIASRTGGGLLVAAGVGFDSRGALELLKQARPELTILAVNERPASELSYVGQGDYCLTDDAQHVLPTIMRSLERT